MSELQRDLNEFVLWLEEADTITSTPLAPGNEKQLREKLEQVKVIFFLNSYLFRVCELVFSILVIDAYPS